MSMMLQENNRHTCCRNMESRNRWFWSTSLLSIGKSYLLLTVLLLFVFVGLLQTHSMIPVVLAFGVSSSPNRLHRSSSSCTTTSTTTTTTTITTSTQLWNAKVATAKVYASTAVAIVPLFPEPPGGIELQPLLPNTSSIGASRMKQLDTVLPSSSSSSSSTGSPVYQFWMTTYTDGKSIQEIRQTILKDASKKANFPGFRKGQVPPYAQPQITQFAIQESIIKKVEQMVLDYGLQSISGSDGQVQVHEDVSEMTKLYKTGTSILFTATLSARYDETKIRQQEQEVQSASTQELKETVIIENVETNADEGTITETPIVVPVVEADSAEVVTEDTTSVIMAESSDDAEDQQ